MRGSECCWLVSRPAKPGTPCPRTECENGVEVCSGRLLLKVDLGAARGRPGVLSGGRSKLGLETGPQRSDFDEIVAFPGKMPPFPLVVRLSARACAIDAEASVATRGDGDSRPLRSLLAFNEMWSLERVGVVALQARDSALKLIEAVRPSARPVRLGPPRMGFFEKLRAGNTPIFVRQRKARVQPDHGRTPAPDFGGAPCRRLAYPRQLSGTLPFGHALQKRARLTHAFWTDVYASAGQTRPMSAKFWPTLEANIGPARQGLANIGIVWVAFLRQSVTPNMFWGVSLH